VDDLIGELRLFIGTWEVASNNPDISAGSVDAGWYLAQTVDPTISESPPSTPAIPGLPVGTMIHNGDMVIWENTHSRWDLIRSSPLTLSDADARYLRLDGGVMQGPLTLQGPATSGLMPVTYQQLQTATTGLVTTTQLTNQLSLYLLLAGGTMTGPITLSANAAGQMDVPTLSQVQALIQAGGGGGGGTPDLSQVLHLSGGTMTGPLVLAANATGNLQAVTLQQMNSAISNAIVGTGFVPLTGATMTGPLILSGPASAQNGAVTLAQLNSAISGGPTGSFLPLSGGTMTGPITLSGNAATGTNQAVPMAQLTSVLSAYATTTQLGNFVLKSGDTMTGSLYVTRAGGAEVILTRPTASGSNWCSIVGNTGVAASTASTRWAIFMPDNTTESASQTGGNFLITRYNNNGALLDSPISIARATGIITIPSQGIIYSITQSPNAFAFGWFGNNPFVFVDDYNVGWWQLTASDSRLKRNLKPPSIDCLDQICGIQIQQFDMTSGHPDDHDYRHWDAGYIADQVRLVMPDAVVDAPKDGPAGVDLRALCARLIGAVQQLTGRVRKLEAAAA
jgi:hypothetical protein